MLLLDLPSRSRGLSRLALALLVALLAEQLELLLGGCFALLLANFAGQPQRVVAVVVAG